MNLKQLKYVITLAECGSFSNAADVLNISQPSLSQYIKKIEEQINAQLFERSNGCARITDAGKVYIEIGRKIIDLDREMQSRLSDIRENKYGSVIVGTSPFRSVSLLPSVTAKFRERYKGMHIVVREMVTQELHEAAEKGEFDICITTLPVNENVFNFEIIMEEEIVLAVKKDCELDRFLSKEAITFENRTYKAIDATILDNESFVMLTENQIMQKALQNLASTCNLNLITAAVVKSLEAQIEMVGEGVGVAVVPIGIQKMRRVNNNVNYYSFIQELPRRTLAAIYLKNKYLSEPMLDLIDIMKSV